MTEETLYRIAIRAHDRIQKAKGDFYLSEAGIIAELESVRNFTGNVIHLEVFHQDQPDLPTPAVEWLHSRDLPLTYAAFLKVNPEAHARAILVETRRWLHHQRIDQHMRVEKLRREHKPYMRVRPDPITEGHIVAMEGQIAWMDEQIKQLGQEIDKHTG